MSADELYPLEEDSGKRGQRSELHRFKNFWKLCLASVETSYPNLTLRFILNNLGSFFAAKHCYLITINTRGNFSYLGAPSANAETANNYDDHVCKKTIFTVLNQKRTVLNNCQQCQYQKDTKNCKQTSHKINSILCSPIEFNHGIRHILYLDKTKDEGQFQSCDIKAINVVTKLIASQTNELIINIDKLRTKSNSQLGQRLRQEYDFNGIVGHDPRIIELLDLIVKVKDVDVPILIEGESGTGKELIVRAIHYNSKRKNEPLICVNCGAIPENLLESEFFGYEKGAFTGATNHKLGHIAAAGNGAIFLDEIDELNLNLQVKLLRVIQWGEFTPIGSTKPQKMSARFIAASKCQLKDLVKKNKFRDDLFYRLNVLRLCVPPLRERTEDIPVLCTHLLNNYCKMIGKKELAITPRALNALMSYDYPGNVRELENILQGAAILSEGDFIDLEQLPFDFQQTMSIKSGSQNISEIDFKEAKRRVIEDFEKKYLCSKLEDSKGIILRAAKKAGMYEANFRRKMKKYGILTKAIQQN